MAKSSGNKHTLILNKSSIDRRWMSLFPAGLVMAGWLGFSGRHWENIGFIPALPEPYDLVFVVVMVTIFAYSLYSLFARSRTFVQARPDHLRLVAPLMSVKLSYRRIRMVHPSHMEQVFPRDKTKGSLRKAIAPYYNRTAVVLNLRGYPMNPVLLRMFFGKSILLPAGEGIVLLVNDWMNLSTEIDSMMGTWKQGQSRKNQESHPSMELLKTLRKK